MHWYLISYKAILGISPSYLCCLIKQKIVFAHNFFLYSVPFVRSELAKKAFMYAARLTGIFCNLNLNYNICCLWIILK